MKRTTQAATLGIVLVALLAPAGTAQITVTSEEWGGGRLYVLGEEIVPPLEFFRIWVSDPALVVNGTIIDPLPCPKTPGPREPDPPIRCGNEEGHRPAVHPDERFVEDLIVVSVRPLVALGCEYFYCPEGEAAERVLEALDRGDFEGAIAGGAPPEFIRDIRKPAALHPLRPSDSRRPVPR